MNEELDRWKIRIARSGRIIKLKNGQERILEPGHIQIFNRKRKSWDPPYSDIYSALRSRKEILLNYKIEVIKINDIFEGLKLADQIYENWEVATQEEKNKCKSKMESLVYSLLKIISPWSDQNKILAREGIQKSSNVYDVLGRENPSSRRAILRMVENRLKKRIETMDLAACVEKVRADLLEKLADFEERIVTEEALKLGDLFLPENLNKLITHLRELKESDDKIRLFILRQGIKDMIQKLRLSESRLRLNVKSQPWLTYAQKLRKLLITIIIYINQPQPEKFLALSKVASKIISSIDELKAKVPKLKTI